MPLLQTWPEAQQTPLQQMPEEQQESPQKTSPDGHQTPFQQAPEE